MAFESLTGQPEPLILRCWTSACSTSRAQSLLNKMCYLPNECISRAFKFKASTILAGRQEKRMGRQDGSRGPPEPSRRVYQKSLLILGSLRPSPTAQAGWAVIASSPLLRPEAHGVRGRGLHHVHSLDSIIVALKICQRL